ncbi:hypothetical protein PhaeoP88_00558 [Phaeobacter inhibens]|uniref:Uncharacterized protein n=1 Tax=Phaeobacter inhibens TaxID=221822 RepID=A0A2I7K5U9_9RHOB|nr:hypothetical protein PhaeoP88_00558 [Phaeobacter inhibens]
MAAETSGQPDIPLADVRGVPAVRLPCVDLVGRDRAEAADIIPMMPQIITTKPRPSNRAGRCRR